ncbi:MAG: uroporphyrinogen decarboxylase [Verrucomicrobia bacterium]|nr:uroporphyrinogen decarboxylase [Verrucomicrobiota bacterium]
MSADSITNEVPLSTRLRATSTWESSSNVSGLSNRERFVRACNSQPVDRPPIWLMRQAGRCLPEYRALKEKYSFTDLVQAPELAAEVTIQPVRRFDFDAAILFSDILVIPEALGQKYRFRDSGGIEMDFLLNSVEDIARLRPEAVHDELKYVPAALALIKEELAGRTALIGFAGSPWTLANYMLEGGSSKEFTKAKTLFYSDRPTFELLMGKLTTAITAFLQMQIDAGVDAVQIFDSSGGILADSAFEAASAKWMREIVRNLRSQVPVIVFSKGAHGNWEALARTGAQVLGADWTVNLSELWGFLPHNIGVQGNLDPFLLNTTPEIISCEAIRLLREMKNCPGHIFNLGHGVPPTAKLETIEALVQTVKNFK